MLRQRTGTYRAEIGELRCGGDVFVHVWKYKSCATLFMGRRCSVPFNHVALISMMVIDCCLSQWNVCKSTAWLAASRLVFIDTHIDLVVVLFTPSCRGIILDCEF